jgi:hypothetical protein
MRANWQGARPQRPVEFNGAFSNGDAWVQIRPLIWVGGWPVTGQPVVPVPGGSAS